MSEIIKIGGKVINELNKNRVTKKILKILYIKTGLCDFLNRNRKCKKAELLQIQNFYEENKNSVEYNISLLADEKSKEIYRNLIHYRCFRYRSDLRKIDTNDQYFVDDIIKLTDNEVFVDAGAYNGDTVQKFIEKANNKYKKIICFEPDVNNCEQLKNNTRDYKNIEIFEYGLFSEEKSVNFSNVGTDKSRIGVSGSNTIKTIRLDSIETCKDVTFIKMDIEGAELEALKGAEAIIKNNKPKLAICIYHSDNDMINIIKFIHELVPEYKLYVRHHSIFKRETVLYAII